MKTSTRFNVVLLVASVGLGVMASWPGFTDASPTKRPLSRLSAGTAGKSALHRRDTVMYYVTGDARSAVVSYTDARGVTVDVGCVRFPWKVYLHPKTGAHLSVYAAVASAYPGVTVGIWVNGKLLASGVSDGDPHAYTEASATLGEGNGSESYFLSDGPGDGDERPLLGTMKWPQIDQYPMLP